MDDASSVERPQPAHRLPKRCRDFSRSNVATRTNERLYTPRVGPVEHHHRGAKRGWAEPEPPSRLKAVFEDRRVNEDAPEPRDVGEVLLVVAVDVSSRRWCRRTLVMSSMLEAVPSPVLWKNLTATSTPTSTTTVIIIDRSDRIGHPPTQWSECGGVGGRYSVLRC